MHGRPRHAAKPVDDAASAEKSAQLRELQAQFLRYHRDRVFTSEALLTSAKLLEINPESYTAWNYRKLALQNNLSNASDAEAVKSAVDDELRMVEVALRCNPKFYGAWYHRKWVLRQKLSPPDFAREFRLLDKLLKVDSRNFHGWNYRRFIARLKDASEVEELKFTMDMIDTNFSNYSAWHNRSMLLSNLMRAKVKGFESKQQVLMEEFELVRQALFTDPNDQSGWFYHLWLLDQISGIQDPQLISSWPSNGSKLVLSYSEGTLPIVLYFNRRVGSVNASTVAVKSDLNGTDQLSWNPLTPLSSGEANCWTAYVKLPVHNAGSSSQMYEFEISLACSKNIVSGSGPSCSPSPKCKFSVTLHDVGRPRDSDLLREPFSWNSYGNDRFKERPDFSCYDPARAAPDASSETVSCVFDSLSDEISLFKEMLEEDSKFVKLTLARLLAAQSKISPMRCSDYHEEALQLYDDLIKLDPSHGGYYADERSLVLLDQVLWSKDNVLEQCVCYEKPEFPDSSKRYGVRLTGLGLTRVGFVERLLWVQVLDLSNNKLGSIAGLEALACLVSLNLSHNKIRSFTALDPLKMLTSLRVLDLTYNKIGAHRVDTTRYVCSSSPLSNTTNLLDINGLGEHWEFVLLLKPMKLVQLDLHGNEVAGEKLTLMAAEIMSSLLWIDGKRVR